MNDAGLPKSDRPEDVGFSTERLKRITEAFRKAVDSGDIPGAVVLIARQGPPVPIMGETTSRVRLV